MAKRLKYLHYRLVLLSDVVSFIEGGDPVEATLNGFHCVADINGMRAEPLEDVVFDDRDQAAVQAEAVSALQPALEAWSATSELIDGSPMAFEFTGASTETVDDGSGDQVSTHSLMDTGSMTEVWAVAKNNLPEPHPSIRF